MLKSVFSLVKTFKHGLVVNVELDAVYPVADSKPRVDNAFDESYDLLIAVFGILIVETSDRHKDLAQSLLLDHEVLHGEADFKIRVEEHLVEETLEMLWLLEVVEQVGMVRLVSQVDLQVLALRHFIEVLVVVHLAFDERQEPIAHA